MSNLLSRTCLLGPVLCLSVIGCGVEPMDTDGKSMGSDTEHRSIAAKSKWNPPLQEFELPFHGAWDGNSRWTGFDNFYGYNLNTGSLVDQATFVYQQWNPLSAETYGPWGGPGGSNSGWQICIDSSEWLVGVYGREGSALDQLGFICANPYNPASRHDLPAFGGGGGTPFREVCPNGMNIGQIGLYTGTYVYGIKVYCWNQINP
jgi:hypothetical protein